MIWSQHLRFFIHFVAGLGVLTPSCWGAANESAVQLDKVVVTAKSLEENQHWRYTKAGEFEILSQTDDATVIKLIEQLEVMPLVVKTIWPGPATIKRETTSLILCASSEVFAAFIPPEVSKTVDATWIDRLFFKDGTKEVIVILCGQRTTSECFKDILRDYARRCLLALRQPPPDWFVTGMAEIITNADSRVTANQLKIHYASLDKVHMHNPAEGLPLTLYDTEHTSPAVREIIRGALNNRSRDDRLNPDGTEEDFTGESERFNDYFALSPYHPDFAEVLKNSGSLNPDDYRMTCWAFVHLCAFAQKRGFMKPLRELLILAGKNPQGDMVALFKEAFKSSTRSMGSTVAEYSTQAMSRGITKEIPFTRPDTPMINDASPLQICQFKADAYRLGGHPAEAEEQETRARRLAEKAPVDRP